MVNPSEFAEYMLGAPVLKLEINQAQLAAIYEYVVAVLATSNVALTDAQKQLVTMDGMLAYCKYVVGRIRSKYQNVPGYTAHPVNEGIYPCDGPELVTEALDEIASWKAKLGV